MELLGLSLINIGFFLFLLVLHRKIVRKWEGLYEKSETKSAHYRTAYHQKDDMHKSLLRVNKDLREKIRFQSEKALTYKAEIELLKSNGPQYKRRDKSADADKPKPENKVTRRGNNIRGADGKWVKNIGQVVEKKVPLTLDLK
jgi:hypothetical protein